jgi:hypothetical protein
MEETFSPTNSVVGEMATVGARVGRIVSIVAVGIAVGGILVEIDGAVDLMTGAGAGVQAVRKNKMAMNFFMGIIICHCEERLPRRSNLL